MKQISKLLIVFTIIFSMFLLPLSINASGNDAKEINHLSDADRIKIEEYIKEQMDKASIPGLSVAIVKGEETVYQKGFGYSDIKAQKPVTSESLFELGSNSKAFTALAILNLQEDGLIKLEDEVTKYIPWLVVKYQGKEVPITLEQLLHHTSGVPFRTIDKIPVSDSDDAMEETVKTIINLELNTKPGENYLYATINYDVLGLVIQNVTGLSYEEYVEENVIKPMGLNNTYLYHNEAVDKNLAKGYKLGFLNQRLYDAPAYRGNKPAGYIISSAEDMAKWLKIQMGTDKTSKFSKELVEASHMPDQSVSSHYNGVYYAAGWHVVEELETEIFHGGNNPNYSSFITIGQDDQIGIAILSNTNSQYIPRITWGINEILQQHEPNINAVNDMNTTLDKPSVVITAIFSLLVLVMLYFNIKTLRQVFMKERKFKGIGIKNVLQACISLILMLVLSYFIYKIPYYAYNGVSWKFAFVWLPVSIQFAFYLVYIYICLLYIYILLTSFYKKKDRKYKKQNTMDVKQ